MEDTPSTESTTTTTDAGAAPAQVDAAAPAEGD